MNPRVAIVLWAGEFFGGAETASIALAGALRRRHVDASVVFVGLPGVYEKLLREAQVPGCGVGLARGRHVVLHPRRFARTLDRVGPDCAVLPSAGYLATAARAGGYRGAIIAVEHGGLLQVHRRSYPGRLAAAVDRAIGRRSIDAQVAVSEFLLGELMKVPHADKVVRIHNGVDLARFGDRGAEARSKRRAADDRVVIGSANKLMDGKGFDDLIGALALLKDLRGWRCEVAGDGALRPALESAARSAGILDRVAFRGWVSDMPAFWAGCDIAVAASNGCVESFGMVVAEAMASGIPAVVSTSGGLPEVLGEAGAGVAFDVGDVAALSRALSRYVQDRPALEAASVAASSRAEEFDIGRTAERYQELISELRAVDDA